MPDKKGQEPAGEENQGGGATQAPAEEQKPRGKRGVSRDEEPELER
jgi:hypothetical protein